MLFYSMPAYLFGFGLLLLFEPSFGAFHLPAFFHPGDYENPGDDLWKFVEAMTVPWLIVAAPFAAVVMRLVQAEAVDELETDYVRTAEAKGLSRRGRGPPPRGAAGVRDGGVGRGRVGAQPDHQHGACRVRVLRPRLPRPAPRRARRPAKLADVALVQGLALWGAVLIVAVSVLADLVLVTLDPRVR